MYKFKIILYNSLLFCHLILYVLKNTQAMLNV